MNFANPFNENHFVGRDEITSIIQSQIFEPDNPNNLAIIGVHRVGQKRVELRKQSLVRNKN